MILFSTLFYYFVNYELYIDIDGPKCLEYWPIQ